MSNKIMQVLCNIKEDLFEKAQIEISGNNEIVIQGTKGIIEYQPELIRINLRENELDIHGEKLTISCLTSDSLTVSGIITKLEWVG